MKVKKHTKYPHKNMEMCKHRKRILCSFFVFRSNFTLFISVHIFLFIYYTMHTYPTEKTSVKIINETNI